MTLPHRTHTQVATHIGLQFLKAVDLGPVIDRFHGGFLPPQKNNAPDMW